MTQVFSSTSSKNIISPSFKTTKKVIRVSIALQTKKTRHIETYLVKAAEFE